MMQERRVLSEDAHLSCGFLTNADWLVPVFEFPPTAFPVNHGDKAVEIGRNAFGLAIFHPHTELRPMFAFNFAGVWLAHLLVLYVVAARFHALPALFGWTLPTRIDLLQKLDGLLGLGLRDSSQRVALMERSVVRARRLCLRSPQSLFPAIKKPEIASTCLAAQPPQPARYHRDVNPRQSDLSDCVHPNRESSSPKCEKLMSEN